MTQDPNPGTQDLETLEEMASEIGELVAQLGLSTEEAATAWNAVLGELESHNEASAAASAAGTDATAAERFDAGALIDLLGSGKQPDLTEIAKDELVKAVAKKLGIDPEKAGPVVDMILKMLDKPTTKRRRKTAAKKTPKKSTAKGKRPATSSGSSRPKNAANSSAAKKRPKAKPSSTSTASASVKPAAKKKRPTAEPAASAAAKPAAKKKRPAAKPAASATTKPAAKKKPATSKPKPTASTSTSKPRRRSPTRGDTTISGVDE